MQHSPIRFLVSLVLLLPFISSAQDDGVRVVTRIVKDAPPAWSTWYSDAFSMNHPSDWSVREGDAGDTVVVFSQSKEGQAKPVEVLVLRTDSDQVQPDAWATGAEQDLIATRGKPGTNGWQTEYRFRKDGNDMHVREEMIIRNNRPYTLVYMAPEAVYDEFLYLADAMIKSFSPVMPEE